MEQIFIDLFSFFIGISDVYVKILFSTVLNSLSPTATHPPFLGLRDIVGCVVVVYIPQLKNQIHTLTPTPFLFPIIILEYKHQKDYV